MNRLLRSLAAWLIAGIVLVWRRTCRYHVIDDPRPALREAGSPYIYALLHAHQVAAVFVNDERRMAAMVSRSMDGDLLVPSLRLRHVTAVRGSSRRGDQDKGGRQALADLAALNRTGVPCLLAVDGPKGPRNTVHRGVADLAQTTNAVILPVVVVPTKRWFLRKTWDRMQLPKPFSVITLRFAAPLRSDAPNLRVCVAQALAALEQTHDPAEAARVTLATQNAA